VGFNFAPLQTPRFHTRPTIYSPTPVNSHGVIVRQQKSYPYRTRVHSPAHSPNMIPARPHKQSMNELKLRRIEEYKARLREDLARPRQRISEASVT